MIGSRLKDAPSDINELAQIIGISGKQLRALQEKHGDKLLLQLQRQWRDRQDRPRFLHRDSSHGYTDTPSQALDGVEAVPEEFQAQLSAEGRARFAEMRAEDVARANAKSRAARLRKMEATAQKKGVDALPHLLRIESEMQALEAKLEAA